MKFKKEYAILLGVLVVLVLYLVLHSSDQTHYDLLRLPEITPASISSIEVVKPDLTYQLTRKDDQWRIEPGDFPADDTKAADMLNAIRNLNITALVSESGNYSRYELDDTRKISVKAWAGDTLKRDFMIGKPASTYRHTHVRVADHAGVYHAEGNFRDDFDLDIDQLRDKQVLQFETDTIREIHITREKEKFLITQTTQQAQSSAGDDEKEASKTASDTATVWQTTTGKTVQMDDIKALLSKLSHLQCESYLENLQKKDMKAPVMTFELKSEDSSCTLSIFRQENEVDSGFPGISSQNDDVFRLAEYQVENIKKAVAKILSDTE
jgi:hypothetical protein